MTDGEDATAIHQRVTCVERATNSVHRGFREERWKSLKHYLLSFHDDTFECLAEGSTTELVAGTFRQVVELAVDRVFRG